MSEPGESIETLRAQATQRAQLYFWRATTVALLTFLLGILVPLVSFGLRAATKDDVQTLARAQDDRDKAIEDRLEVVQQGLDFITGELRAKGIDKGRGNE